MNTLRWLRMGALGALAFSAAAAVDGYLGTPTFCMPGSGCDAVRHSDAGQLLSAYLPGAGLFGFSLLFWGSMLPNMRVRRAVMWLGVAGGLAGLGLLALQWLQVGSFCSLCLGADLFALLVAGLSGLAIRNMPVRATSWPVAAWAALFVAAVGVPPVYALSRPDTIPAHVLAQHEPGKINVVEISDFECPFCRRLHEPLMRALAPYKDEVHFVRLTFPLPGHPHALPASRAYLCAEEQGQGDVMADRLFTADLARVTPTQLTLDLPIDHARFETCLEAPETQARLDAIRRRVVEGGLDGLPTVYIGHEALLGFDQEQGAAPYEAALARAAEGHYPTHAPWPWIVLGVVVLGLATASTRAARKAGHA